MLSNRMAATLHVRNYCKMAIANAESASKRVRNVLELLETPEHCSSFSERGKRQMQGVQRFKEAIGLQENKERFCLF